MKKYIELSHEETKALNLANSILLQYADFTEDPELRKKAKAASGNINLILLFSACPEEERHPIK